ncbi:uncharacterized protein APUU_71134A [Aspergillus puulaauensis]|uniref:Uncharacterized protein n=1 Tax=Aspergillus puulaauensis TaxID=1220207 RepID=A0A7R7XZN0_9EURO|nr:uncharacterized protein APUU_71134A [Aspergillus puulaauensis]BCS29564.1 hypothetical protein APUU_71134A [Aspergillus puulaauensis]
MRLSLILLSLGIPHAVLADPQQNPLDLLNNVEGLSNLKKFVSIASTLSSLVDDNEDDSPPEKQQQQQQHARADSASDDSPDLSDGIDLSQMKNVASVASTLFSLLGDNDKVAGSDAGESNEATNANADADQDTPDILKKLSALQDIVSFASGIGSLLDTDDTDADMDIDVQNEDSNPPRSIPELKPETPPEPEKAEPTPIPQEELNSTPEAQDMLARIEAIQRLNVLVKKLTVLTDEKTPTPITERLQLLFSDPEFTSTFSYIFENGGKVLTPEVVAAFKVFLNTSPAIPDEYRTIAVGALDTLSSAFSPEFVEYYRTAKEALDRAGIELIPALEYLWRAVQWARNTLDRDYIKALNQEVVLWHRALTSEQMGEFVAYITDEETLGRVTASVARFRKTLTPDRAHRLHALFEDQGIFDQGDLEYQAYGHVMGKRIKFYFGTEDGVSEVERLLDLLDGPLQGQTMADVAGILQTRARVLTPYMADDLATFFYQFSEVTEVVDILEEILRDIVQLVRPLLDVDTRAARVLSWAFWTDLNQILDKVLSVPGSSLTTLQKLLATASKLLEPERAKGLRLLVADASGTPRTPGSEGFDVPGNDSAVDTGSMMGVVDTESKLAPDVTEDALRVLHGADALLAPGQIDKTRDTVLVLSEAGEFLVKVVRIFEDDDAGGHVRHDEL